MIVPVINTHSSCKDIWSLFFGQFSRHFPVTKAYVFVDKCDYVFPDYVKVIYYDQSKCFTEQYLQCISKVDEELCLYLNEDYIFFDTVDIERINRYSEFLRQQNDIHFIKLLRGVDNPDKMIEETLYEIPSNTPYLYTQQPNIWKTRVLQQIHSSGPKAGIGVNSSQGHFETLASQTCRDLGVKGLFCYNGEPKRGMYHYDSSVINCILSALNKGKWNFSEYRNELTPLIYEYGINPNNRGIV